MRYPGHYTDGFTAQRHDVFVQAGRSALHLTRDTGETLDEWPYAGLFTAEEVHGAGPVRLRHRQRGEALLTVEDAALLDRIVEHGGPRLRAGYWQRPTLRVALGALVLLALVVGAAYWLGPRLVPPLARLVPTDWERALGQQVVAAMANDQPACSGSAGVAALQRLSDRLTSAVKAELGGQAELPYPIHVQVLPGETINAFAAPGGEIVLLEGLLDFAQTPEEVAGVLAHEMAHVVRRHPMQGLIRAAGTSLVIGTLLGDTSSLESAAGQFTQWLVLTSYTREDELAADRVAVRVLNGADIDSQGLIRFFERVAAKQAEHGSSVPSILSTHPLFEERIALAREQGKGHGEALTRRQWKALQTVCEG